MSPQANIAPVETFETLKPYTPRSGVGVKEDVETLLSDLEVELSEEDRGWAYEIAQGLFDGRLGAEACESPRDLEVVHQVTTDSDTHTFHKGYFGTGQGIADLEALGIESEASWDAICARLLDVEAVKSRIDSEARQEIAARSKDWYKEWLAECVARDDDNNFVDQDVVVVNFDPDLLLQKLEDLSAYRKFYRRAQGEINQLQSPQLRRASQVLLNQYRARVNEMVAELYGDALYLVEQVDKTRLSFHGELRSQSAPYSDSVLKGLASRVLEGAPELIGQADIETDPKILNGWERRLDSTLPVLDAVYHSRTGGSEVLIDSLSERLDLVRMGAGRTVKDGQISITPISGEVKKYAAELESRSSTPGDEEYASIGENLLPPEVVSQLDKIVWDAGQLVIFVEAVLREQGILSEYATTWEKARKRDGFAPDGKYQVVKTPDQKHVSVSSERRLVLVPEDFKRSLTSESPAGALPLIAHELAHVKQSYFDYEIGEKIPLAKVKGKRVSAGREASGIVEERIVQREYFGRDRRVNTHYLRALEVKEDGGNKAEVARAFYESYVGGKNLDERGQKKARKHAADRVSRFYLHHGHNSKPLVYIEQALIVDELESLSPGEKAAFLVMVGSLNIHDSADLKKVGLLELPSDIEINTAHDTMRVFIRDFMEDELEKARRSEAVES